MQKYGCSKWNTYEKKSEGWTKLLYLENEVVSQQVPHHDHKQRQGRASARTVKSLHHNIKEKLSIDKDFAR